MLTVGRNVENVGKSESQPAAAAVSGRNPPYFLILSCFFFFLFHFSAFVLTFVCSFGRFGWFGAVSRCLFVLVMFPLGHKDTVRMTIAHRCEC